MNHKVKMFEIRDRGTFIPAIAVRLKPVNEAERYLAARAGYGVRPWEQGEYVLLTRLSGDEPTTHHAPEHWGGRTMPVAHRHITESWDDLETGQVIDVEHVLGETAEPKKSEQNAD
ncbi:MAG: hypothetical protein GY926_19450 [bacterium]|nr:hypothetical protein [bacterium]